MKTRTKRPPVAAAVQDRGPARLDRRAAGLLLHITSLAGPHGSGDLGREAFEFADFLAESRMRWWQMLPTGPIGRHHSPYSAQSAFAGSSLHVSLQRLVEDGLLAPRELRAPKGLKAGPVIYPEVIAFRQSALRRAYQAFRAASGGVLREFDSFCAAHADWLDDFALYEAIKHSNGGGPWTEWPLALRRHDMDAVRRARDLHADGIRHEQFVQFLFYRQWSALKRHCNERDIGLIGDIPIYVALDSCDVWSHQDLFLLDDRGRPLEISGYPPDGMCATGQFWGDPIYRWDAHRKQGFAWWIERIRSMLSRFDAARIDHFLGFHRYWSIPGRARTAASGRWKLTPGHALLAAVARAIGRPQIIAEDLGAQTPEALALRDLYGFPGMRILVDGFGGCEAARYHQPHSYPRNCAAYPGTHDTNTAVGWFRRVSRQEPGEDGLTDRDRVLCYVGTNGREIHWDLIRIAFQSVATLAIAAVQDVLGLDESARMNRPGTTSGNWEWRMRPGALKPQHARRLREMAESYQRA